MQLSGIIAAHTPDGSTSDDVDDNRNDDDLNRLRALESDVSALLRPTWTDNDAASARDDNDNDGKMLRRMEHAGCLS